MSKSFGARLKEIRGARTQVEFAAQLGISSKTLIRYEKDESSPDIDLILKLNLLFGIQPMWLLTGIAESTKGEQLAADEFSLLRLYRALDATARQAVMAVAERMRADPSGPAALAVSAINLKLLQVCLAGVEEGLESAQREMPPDKKAQLVTMLYDLHQAAESPPQKATILQFIKRAA